MRVVRRILGFIGAVLAFMGSTPYEQVGNNFASYLKALGIVNVPPWLASSTTDHTVLVAGVGLMSVFVVGALMKNWRRLRDKYPKKPDPHSKTETQGQVKSGVYVPHLGITIPPFDGRYAMVKIVGDGKITDMRVTNNDITNADLINVEGNVNFERPVIDSNRLMVKSPVSDTKPAK